MRRRGAICGIAIAICGARCAAAQPVLEGELSFEALANTPVSTVARKPQRYQRTPAAIQVLTREDVSAAGELSLPDVLRLATGVHVAQIDAHSWAVATRGFNSLFSNKLILLIDNRNVYTPLWSGVYWEQHAWLTDEIERIEVVRGSAGSKWGTNAVNGAVNVITRPANETQGLAASGGVGVEERAFGAFRYGAPVGASGWMRAFTSYHSQDESQLETGGGAGDDWTQAHGGFRYDVELGASDLQIQGAVFKSDISQDFASAPVFRGLLRDGHSDGGHLYATWTHHAARTGRINVQTFYSRSDRDLLLSAERRDTFDIEAQQDLQFGPHGWTWGAAYRVSDDEVDNNSIDSFIPDNATTELWSAFGEYEYDAAPWSTTLGVKAERNDDTGWELQPIVRLTYAPSHVQTLWAAASHAVRRPSRVNVALLSNVGALPAGALGPGSPPTLIQNSGSPRIESEDADSYEAGWRWIVGAHAIDLAAFYIEYDDLMGYGAPVLDDQTLAPQFWRLVSTIENLGVGHSIGAELTASWRPAAHWQFDAGYTYLNLDLEPNSNRQVGRVSGSSPAHTLTLRARATPNERWRTDVAVRYVDELPALAIPAYWTADVSVAHALTPRLNVALVGRNLFEASHPEFFAAATAQRTEVERSAFVRISWRSE